MAFEFLVGQFPFHDTEEPMAVPSMRQVSDPIPPAARSTPRSTTQSPTRSRACWRGSRRATHPPATPGGGARGDRHRHGRRAGGAPPDLSRRRGGPWTPRRAGSRRSPVTRLRPPLMPTHASPIGRHRATHRWATTHHRFRARTRGCERGTAPGWRRRSCRRRDAPDSVTANRPTLEAPGAGAGAASRAWRRWR